MKYFTEKQCRKCNKVFYSYTCQNRKFCSRTCSASYTANARGKKWSMESRLKKSEAINLLFLNKENHPRWISDRSKLAKRQERNDSAYREWRKSVRDRDDWKCKMSNNECLGKVVAHHILPWSKFPELRYEVNNGITLCEFHHPRKRDDEIRLSPYFQFLLVNET